MDYISFSVRFLIVPRRFLNGQFFKWLYSKFISPTSFLQYRERSDLWNRLSSSYCQIHYSNADLRIRSHVGQGTKTCSKSIRETLKQKVKDVHQNDFIWRSDASILTLNIFCTLQCCFHCWLGTRRSYFGNWGKRPEHAKKSTVSLLKN